MKPRVKFIDYLRVSAMFCVVFLHASATLLRQNIDLSWQIDNILTSIATIAVPIFFMISGAMLLSRNNVDNLSILYKRQLPKLVIPFLIWSIISVLVLHYKFRNYSSILKDLLLLPSKPGEIALWFMYPFIIMYMLSPMFKLIVDNKKLLKYTLLIWLLFVVILPSIPLILPAALGINPLFIPNDNWLILEGYVGFFFLGYYLYINNFDISLKKLMVVLLISIIIISFGTYIYTNHMNKYFEGFKSYRSLFTVILSTDIFLIFKKFKFKATKVSWNIIKFIVPTSYGVYLIHNLIILLISNRIYKFMGINLLSTLVLFIIASILSIIIIYILGHIPKIGKYLIGIQIK